MSLHIRSGPWSPDATEAWLRSTVIPLRIATTGKRGPLVQSVWFVFEESTLWCATQRESVLARRLRRDAQVGWEVAADLPPYRGARGTGRATLVEEPERAESVLRTLLARYGQEGSPLADWLLSRCATEVAVAIEDLHVVTWDYSPRM